MPAKSKKRRLLKKSRSHKLNFKAPWFVLLLLLLLGTLFVYLYRSFSQPARIAEIAGVQPFKQALEITDQNSAVILPPLISDGSFTFEAWIYPNSFTSQSEDRYIFSQPSNNSGIQTSLSLQGNADFNEGKGSLVGWYWEESGPRELRTPFVVTPNSWHHVVFQRDLRGVKIFLNGKIIATTTTSSTSPKHSRLVFTLGGYNSQPIDNLTLNNVFLGKLDNIYIYDQPKYAHDFDIPSEPIWQPGIIASYELNNDYLNGMNWQTHAGTPVGDGLVFVESTVPTSPPNQVSWETPQVSLSADDFYLVADGVRFDSRNTQVTLHSDPGNPNYTTLETTWHEKDREMRLNIYFYAEDVATTNGTLKQWGVSQIRTYDGKTPGDWIYYDHRNGMGWYGEPRFINRFVLTSTSGKYQGYLVFKNLKLLAFKTQPSLPPIPSTFPSPSPSIICKNTCGNGTCEEIVCLGTGCPCPETPISCPKDCSLTTQKSTITILAAGTKYADLYPTMALRINGRTVMQWKNVRGNPFLRTFQKFTYTHPTKILPTDKLQVAFTNDFSKRDLRVNLITIDGKVFQSESAVTFSTGTKSPDGWSRFCYARSEWLNCNGYFQYKLTTLPTPTPKPTPTPTPKLTPTPTPTPIPVPLISAYPSPTTL